MAVVLVDSEVKALVLLEKRQSKVYKVVSSHHLQRLFPTCCGTREDLARSLFRKYYTLSKTEK